MEISNSDEQQLNNNNNNSPSHLTNTNNRGATTPPHSPFQQQQRLTDSPEHPPTKRLLLTTPHKNNNTTTTAEAMNVDNEQHNESMETSISSTATNTAATPMVTSSDGDDDSRAEATFQFVLVDFAKWWRENSKDSRLSPACVVRNLPWKILAMLKQTGTPTTPDGKENKSLGFFLQCNAECESARWSVCATAELRLLHVSDPEKNYVKKIQHLFYSKENDWGFSPFMSIKEIMDPERGFYNAQQDSITLEVWVNADAPHGTAWDSKKLTGFVGLTNQGATCYMNSLLQTLYFTSELRRAVYLMPTENDDPVKSVPYGLQRVFYDLQFGEKSVGTKKLTRSFGWETLDTFMQHDVQELCRVLMDNIENKMKGTKVEGVIPRLFEGKMISYIKCKNIDYESRRTEGFYDIQLNIKGKKDIYESFKDYVAVESLEGENKYDAGKFGMQEAQKGVKFDSLPPILHLHLMRFQYDPATDSNIKINDRYEFYEQIELDSFLEKPEATPAKYTLHAVLVHSGDNHGGHYVVFINPRLDGKWFKFDDEVVSRCTKKDAINNNFGGSSSDDLTFRHSTNAYMLVYLRDSMNQLVLNEVKRDEIPQGLQERLQEERRQDMIKKRERNEAHLYMQLHIILEEEFYKHLGNADLYDTTKVEYTRQLRVKKSNTINEVLQQIGELLNQPAEDVRIWPIMGRYNSTIRPTKLIDSSEDVLNRTVQEVSRQDTSWTIFVETAADLSFKPYLTIDSANGWVVKEAEQPGPGSDLHHHEPSTVTSPTKAAAATMTSSSSSPSSAAGGGSGRRSVTGQHKSQLPPHNPGEHIMIFFKYYEPKAQILRYVFRMHLNVNDTLNMVQERINKKMRFPPGTELLFNEEVKINQITELSLRDVSLAKQAHEQLLDGDIYVFQINEKEKLKQYKLPTVSDYFKDLMYQVEVQFCDKTVPNDEGFVLLLSQKMKYDEFAAKVAEHLHCDPLKLQFFRCSFTTSSTYDIKPGLGGQTGASAAASGIPTQAIKYSPEMTLKDAILSSASTLNKPVQRKLFYQKIHIKITELEERRQLKCLWISANLKVERELTLMPLKRATVRDLLAESRGELLKEELISQEACADEQNFRLRLVEIVASKLSKVFREDAPIESILEAQTSTKIYRIEQILPDELMFVTLPGVTFTGGSFFSVQTPQGTTEYLLPVAHFNKEVYATFGTPFLLRVRLGEPFKDVKHRIQKRLDINDKDFATYRFALVCLGILTYISDDENTPFEIPNANGSPWLGIDHVNKAAARSKNRYANTEKAIKIFN